MNLCSKQVTHKIFGEGRIVQHDDLYVQVEFPSGIKKFVFPDAFGSFLTLSDQNAADLVRKIAEKKEEKRRKEKSKQIKKTQALHENRQRFLEREKAIKTRKTFKINPRSQSVFWCKAHEVEQIFEEWKVFTGTIKSGKRKGEPRRLARIKPNSAAILTIRDADMAEKNRRILGVFMVDENFSASRCIDGYIPAHSEYRLRLSGQESERMLFWNYYVNKKYPQRMTWNTGRHRYLDNEWVAQILQDIISLKKAPQEREQVQRFFEYFCQLNRLDMEKLPKPAGALISA
ncbi:MAG: malate synthase [Firmicutes bacterium]|nr:malate synthase [Bacillota bacterium]